MRKIYIICALMSVVFGLISCKQSENSNDNNLKDSPQSVEANQPIKMKEESFVAFSAIKEVIQNKRKYLCTENVKLIYLKDFHSTSHLVVNENKIYEYTENSDDKIKHIFQNFCVTDIDGDGKVEVLLESDSSDVFLFHYNKNKVYGYVFPYRGMLELKKDGSFRASGGTAVSSVGKIEFQDKKCIYKELCYFNGLNNNFPIYQIGGKNVRRKGVENYLKEQEEKENEEWLDYCEVNLDRFVSFDS